MGHESNRVYDSDNMTISYQGKILKPGQIEGVTRHFNSLLQWCPCTSYLSASFTEEGENYNLAVTVASQGVVFESQISGLNFDQVISAASRDLSSQIKEWRHRRFFERPGRVLIIDDDPDAIMVLEQCFQKLGWQTNSMTSGTELIRELPQVPKDYNLLVIDIVMPILDGMGTLAAVEKLVDKSYGCGAWRGVRLPFVTYSVKPERDLNPVKASSCFYYLGHIQKGGTFSSLEQKIKNLLISMESIPSASNENSNEGNRVLKNVVNSL